MSCTPSGCPQPPNSVDICPTREEMLPQIISMLPRGRAWGTHDGGPFSGVLLQFWTAVADLFCYMNAQLCALRQEFFCATAIQTIPTWNAEYGLPDGCDPFANLCAKVADQGGNTCAYYTARALAAGWSVECEGGGNGCGGRAGTARAGCMRAGSTSVSSLTFLVNTSASPAYTPPTSFAPRAGRFRAGQKLGCGVQSLAALECLMARIVRAHVEVNYVQLS